MLVPFLHRRKGDLVADILKCVYACGWVRVVRVSGAPLSVIVASETRESFHRLAGVAAGVGKVDGDVGVDREAEPICKLEGVVDCLCAFLADGMALQTDAPLAVMSQLGVLLSISRDG
jgi:hypothetical protein